MAHTDGVNRRSFLQSAGLTALVGAVGPGASLASAANETAVAQAGGKFDFDTVYNRVGTDSVKWDQQIRTYGKDSIQVGMGIADMDFRCAPSITKALTERMQHENWGYLDLPPSFLEGVAAWNKRRYNVNVTPDQMVVTTGVHPGLIATLKAFCPPGSKVLLQTPTYNGFWSDLTASETIAEESPLKMVNGRYEMDFEDFERRIGPDTHALLLCNPQNPTGNCWTEAELLKLGEICLKRRVLVLADEIHCDFVAKGQKYTPFANLPDKAIVNNSVTFKAASKSFGLAAMKCAWFHATNAEYLARIRKQNRADLTTMGMLASKAAYSGGEEWLSQCVEYIDGTTAFAAKYIADNIPLVKTYKPEGTYLMWLDMTAAMERVGIKEMTERFNKGKSAAEQIKPEKMWERWLVKNAKVQLNAGNTYGRGGEGHMRMNIATSRKLVELAVKNLAEALKNPQPSTMML